MPLSQRRAAATAAGTSAAAARRCSRLGTLLWTVAVLAVAVVAYGLIWLPYSGDQSVFALIGREMVRGEVLYTDAWDVKQPGVFLWYAAVEAVAGWSPVLTRTLDVLTAVLTAVLVGRLVRPHVDPALARWVPVAAAAVVLVPLGASDLGQVEQLVCLPMTAALLLVTGRPTVARTLLAGVCVGLVAVLKLMVVVVPLAAIAVWLFVAQRADRDGVEPGPRQAAPRLGLVALGAAVPTAAVLVWLGAAGALGLAVQTWLLGGQQMLVQPGVRPIGRLVKSVGEYALLMAPVLLLAALRVPTALRRRDPLDLALLSWLAAGLVVIVLQLWWPYHWLQLTPAVLALAARGLDDLRRTGRLRRTAVLVLVATSIPLLVFGLLRPERPFMLGNGFTHASRAAIAKRLGTEPLAAGELAGVGATHDDTIAVLGDPIYNLLLDQPMLTRLNTWSPELLTDAQWAELGSSLTAAKPKLILVDHDNTELVATRGPELTHLLETDYSLIRTSEDGDWYRLRPAA